VLLVDPSSFGDSRFDRLKTVIESQGGALIQNMAVAAFLVRLNADSYRAIQGRSEILALEPAN